jgi:phage-related protein
MAGEKAATLKILGNNLDAKEKLAQIKEEADKLREDNPELTVKINRAQASMEMAVLKEQLKGVRDEALETEAAVDSVGKSKLAGLGVGGSLGALGIGGAALGGLSAAIPVVAALGAGILGVGAAFATVGVGVGIFGAVVKTGITDVENANAAHKTLTGGLGDLQVSLAGASRAWTGFTNSALQSGGVGKVVAQGLNLIPGVLKQIQPMLPDISSAIGGIVTRLGKGLNSEGFSTFLTQIDTAFPDALNSVADIAGHVGHILYGAFNEFLPVGMSVLGSIDKITGKLSAEAGDGLGGGGLGKFMSFVSAHGPDVVNVLKNLGSSAVNIGKGLGGLSGVSLPILNALSAVVRVVASNPIGADALAGLLVLTKLGKIASLIGPMVKLIGLVKDFEIVQKAMGAMSALSWGPVGIAIVAIVAVTILLVTHWRQVKAVALDVFHGVLSVISDVFGWVKKNWPLLLGILLGPIALAAALIIMHWDQIEHGAEWLLGKLESFFKGLPGKIVGALGDLGHLLWNAGVSILDGFLNGLLSAWRKVTSFVSGIASWIGSHKGPIEVDAVLLRPHGRAIMGGLVGGLQDGMPGLTSQLSKTTQTIAGTKVAGAAGASGTGVTVTLDWGPNSDQDIISAFRKAIRVRGGNPAIFGR